MIDEAIGKILGMAMAYVASALGMFVAYVNYRKRIVKADKVMSPAAWVAIALSVLAVLGAIFVVSQLAEKPEQGEAAEAVLPEAAQEPVPEAPPPEVSEPRPERTGWTWIGILVPGAIFLLATWITAGLHRHFTTHGHDH